MKLEDIITQLEAVKEDMKTMIVSLEKEDTSTMWDTLDLGNWISLHDNVDNALEYLKETKEN